MSASSEIVAQPTPVQAEVANEVPRQWPVMLAMLGATLGLYVVCGVAIYELVVAIF